MQFPWIKRGDLIAVRHEAGGWVVKDPVTLHYALLDEAEYSILNLMDGRISFDRLMNQIQQLLPDRQLSADDVGEFTGLLAGQQLIRRTVGGDSVRLNPEFRQPSAIRLLRPLFGLLRLHLPLVNPSRLLDRFLPIASVLMGKAARAVFIGLAIAAVSMVLLRFGELKNALPSIEEFLGPSNLLLMLAVFVFVKILHEAGHAFTARYFGAECNECGVMLMVLTPVLYTNVSDSWLLPKHQRLLVTAAGIIVELAIAAVATLLWWFAAPGLTKSLLLNTMLICSVNSILFNGNPLLRFDGYFLLADWVGIPNLASRAGIAVRSTIVRVLTGRASDFSEAPRTHRFLLCYGLLSSGYRILLTLAILQLVQQVCTQWNVEFVGALLSLIILTGFVIFPAARFLGQLFSREAVTGYDHPVWKRMSVCLALLLLIVMLPLPHSIVAPAMVQPDGSAVYAPLPGRLLSGITYGEPVDRGTVVAQLDNAALLQTRARLQARVTELEVQIEALISRPLASGSELLPTLQKSLESAQNQLQEFLLEFSQLRIASKTSGVLLPPAAVPAEGRHDLPERWHGTPLDRRNTGAWIDRGVLLGHTGDPGNIKLLVCVSESEVELVRAGQMARFLCSGGESPVTGTVTEVSQLAASVVPSQFAVSGLMNGHAGEQGLVPSSVSYLVTIQFARLTDGSVPALYSVGRARIHTEPASLFRRVLRYLRRTFS